MNKFVGSNIEGELLPAENSKRRLLSLCATHDFDFEKEHLHEDQTENLEEVQESENEYQEQPDDAWLKEIINKVPITSEGLGAEAIDNIYYIAYEKDKYIKLLSTIPTWSNIMNGIFTSQYLTATSQDVESYFKTLKHHVMDQKMIRADKFLSLHVIYMKTEFKLRMAEGMTARKREHSYTGKSIAGIKQCD